MMKYVITLLIVAFFAVGCKSTKDQSGTTEETQAAPQQTEKLATDDEEWSIEKQEELNLNRKEQDSLVLKLERGACYGACPVYLVQVFNSGYAVINAQQNLEIQGFFVDRFTEEELDKIYELANNAGFFEGESVYDAQVTDLPSTFLYIHLKDKKHKMKLRFNIPEELKRLLKELDMMVVMRDWQPMK